LDDGFGGNSAGARAAFFVKEIQDLAQRIGVRGIPEKSALATHVDQPNLFQLFQVMGERGSGDTELFLDFASDHSRGVGRKEQAENLQARLSAERGEALGGAGNQEWVGATHISIIAEIRKDVKAFFSFQRFRACPHLKESTTPGRGNALRFHF